MLLVRRPQSLRHDADTGSAAEEVSCGISSPLAHLNATDATATALASHDFDTGSAAGKFLVEQARRWHIASVDAHSEHRFRCSGMLYFKGVTMKFCGSSCRHVTHCCTAVVVELISYHEG